MLLIYKQKLNQYQISLFFKNRVRILFYNACPHLSYTQTHTHTHTSENMSIHFPWEKKKIKKKIIVSNRPKGQEEAARYGVLM